MKKSMIKKSAPKVDMQSFAAVFADMTVELTDIINSGMNIIHYCTAPIESEEELLERAEVMDGMFDMAKSETDIVILFATAIADRIEEYEKENLVFPSGSQGEKLAFLMSLKGVKQKDLAEIAPQSVISEIINNHRKMTVEHIKGFSVFFKVPFDYFIE
ncbi:hypothetical protein GCM10023116_29480 [Kistimonas scapharcae]|uniref:HTH cro/C1-type domain-containing protein n=1 Tax=Kistimonas scapharcae TaxID=1036133 RepID=A0ABP8V5X9_9GAMM